MPAWTPLLLIFYRRPWMCNIKPAEEIPLKVILENRLDEKVVLWFYLGVLYTTGACKWLTIGMESEHVGSKC